MFLPSLRLIGYDGEGARLMESEDGGVVKLLWLWHGRGRATGLSVHRSATSGSWLQVATVRISAHAAARVAHHRIKITDKKWGF
jgi:hypothetical protein